MVAPGADPAPTRDPANAIPQIVMIATEERAALRTLLRALRLLPADLEWHATVWSPRAAAPPATLARSLRDRVTFTGADERPESEALATADIAVLASDGVRAAPGTLVRALGAGAVAVASRLPVVRGDPRRRRARPAVRARRGADAGRPSGAADLGPRHAAPCRANRQCNSATGWPGTASRANWRMSTSSSPPGDMSTPATPALRRRLRQRQLIDVDLHMHTDHSSDCATPVEVLLAEAKLRGLGAIAVTDHNEISGALEAQAKASGIKVIVGEEVKTAEQGEVIGLFLTEKIARGMTLQETITEIRRQGGIVYVPHPFDRMHSVPDYEHLLESDRRDRRDRGVRPEGRDLGVQRGGGAVRGQVPNPGRRRLRRPRPRRDGLGADPDA